MDATDISQALDAAFDGGLLYHGYTDYIRDYEVIIGMLAGPNGEEGPKLRYLFTHCVKAHVDTTLDRSSWAESLDERLIDHDKAADLDGYVWGVKWQSLYPGAALVPASAKAARWADALGIPFHEALIEANGHRIRIIFSDLRITEVPRGWSPFTSG